MMRRILLAMLLACASIPAAQADTLYYLTGFSDGLGDSLTGSITTDGQTGLLWGSDITGWQFSLASGGVSQTITSTDLGAYYQLNGAPYQNLSATPTQLFYDFSSDTVQPASDFFQVSHAGETDYVLFQDAAEGGQLLWSIGAPDSPPNSSFVSITSLIEIASTNPVDEPSTIALLCIAGSAGLFLAFVPARRRKTTARDLPLAC
jgi:hypothetical protein